MTTTEVKVIHGRTYLYEIAFAWDKKLHRSRKQTVRYLGRCDPEGHLLHPPRVELEGISSAFPVGALAVFYAQARELRITEVAEEILGLRPPQASLLVALALNQLTGRRATPHVPDWIRDSPLPRWEVSLPAEIVPRDLEGVLEALCHQTQNGGYENRGLLLQEGLNRAWRGSSREPSVAFYDVTKQAYSGTTCPLAQVGYDPERGTGMGVGFGLVISREHHHPILCRPLPGAKGDTLTVPETVDLLKGMGYRHLTMVMDRGMVSKENLGRVTGAGFDQVGLVKDWPEESWAYAGRWPGEGLQKPKHALPRPGGEAVYGRAFTAALYGRRLRLVLVEDPGRKAEERRARDMALGEWAGRMTDARREELTKELKGLLLPARGRRGWQVNEKAVAEERARDGRFLMFSTDLSMEAREIFDLYFQRVAIEGAFRTAKGELSLGPLKYRRVDRIEAYATVVYMAYLLWSWAERKLKKKMPEETMEGALRSLGGVHWLRLGMEKSVRDWCTRLTDRQEEVLKAFGARSILPHP